MQPTSAIAQVIDPVVLEEAVKRAVPAFYKTADFWIGTALSIISLVLTFLAYKAASRAREAATSAARAMKLQTVTIDLAEILQRLDKLETEITFSKARDLLNEVSRRLRRLVGPFAGRDPVKAQYDALLEALGAAKDALNGVRPRVNTEDEEPLGSVYYALQGHFASISDAIAEISGTFETTSLETGNDA